VLTEPMMCNASCILPRPGYLEAMRRITTEHGIVLIFDEVHTGFRVGLSGAQGYFGVIPDLTVLGKAMGAGYPVSCFGGNREIMEGAARNGVRHAGTYNSSPLILAAVDANLGELSKENGVAYRRIGRLATRLRRYLVEIYRQAGWPAQDQGPETVFSIMLLDRAMTSVRDLYRCDTATLMKLRRELRQRGIYTRPAPRDIWYLSTAHTEEDIDRTLQAAQDAVPRIQRVTPV
jgi:glutamate-1-semialdehyde 2,1-aminomutase